VSSSKATKDTTTVGRGQKVGSKLNSESNEINEGFLSELLT